jgi:hypothetical protein
MMVGLYFIVFLLGCAGLAFWVDVRFPRLAPSEPRRVMLCFAAALAVVWLLVPAGLYLAKAFAFPVVSFLVAMGLGIAAGTFASLAVIWLLKVASDVMRRGSIR